MKVLILEGLHFLLVVTASGDFNLSTPGMNAALVLYFVKCSGEYTINVSMSLMPDHLVGLISSHADIG